MGAPPSDSVTPGTASAAPTPGRWILVRLDDNGNEFEMARFEDEAAAQAARLSYERKGHKQLYFIVADPAPPLRQAQAADPV